MRDSFFVAWVYEGVPETAVLVNGCQSIEAAARWAYEYDLPRWVTDDTKLIVYQGNPKNGRKTVFTVKQLQETAVS
ncbi:MAG: hypothetical protein KC421_13500 [Anaerolineales bacterium]|nr:hypothetical protein [Anaerolineales bacterium]